MILLSRFTCLFTSLFFSLPPLTGSRSKIYSGVLFLVFCWFVFIRFPLFSSFIFNSLVICWLVGFLFVSIVIFRLFCEPGSFLLQFLPDGSPLEVSPVICFLELVSFCIRPFVLLLRPVVNLNLGLMVMYSISFYSFCSPSWGLYLCWFLWFLYELFVCLVQWYIVNLILLFTKDL